MSREGKERRLRQEKAKNHVARFERRVVGLINVANTVREKRSKRERDNAREKKDPYACAVGKGGRAVGEVSGQ